MRHGTSSRRQRNRGNAGRRNNQQRSRVYDSNGPDVRIRGTAHQVCEKYMALAKDAASSGNLTMAENYYQHAEHYQRIINGFDSNSESSQSEKQSDNSASAKKNAAPRSGNNKQNNSAEDDLALPKSIIGEKAVSAASPDNIGNKIVETNIDAEKEVISALE